MGSFLRKAQRARSRAFTLIEMLVAAAVLVMLLGMILSVIGNASKVVGRSTESISSFQGARAAFDILTKSLSQATLNSYWDYRDASGAFRTTNNAASFQPDSYGRNSDLHFLVGDAGTAPFPGTAGTGQAVFFQFADGYTGISADQGLEQLLNACGYYIKYEAQNQLPSPFPVATPAYRYILFQALQPSEALDVYDNHSGNAWVANLAQSAVPVAENIVFLSIWPRKSPTDDPEGNDLTSLSASKKFAYDSRENEAVSGAQPDNVHQLPPVLQVMLVALDEKSATRICTGSTPPSEIAAVFAGLFVTPDQTQFEKDLVTLEQRMGAQNLTFRVFTTSIPLRESKMQ
jgi:uncharacterized protein (TIGR02599 family)